MDIESDAAFTSTKVTKNYAKFYPQWKRNNFLSEKKGEEVGEYVDMVMIVSPGQNKDEWHGKATQEIISEYPDQWRAYKEGKEQRISGMPLELLPGLNKGRLDMYKANYVHSIEQLAELSEPARQKFGMGTMDDMKKAQGFLNKGGAAHAKMEAENAEMRATIADMQKQIDALMTKKARKAKADVS
jgi:hypothetical protein